MIRALAIGLLLAAGGCAQSIESATRPATLPAGRWAGEQIELAIDSDGHGRISLPCASAEFTGPAKLDVGGHFLANGTFTHGTGVETIEPPMAVPASISGRLDGNGLLWLDVATRQGYPVRSARLRRGSASNLMRCL